MTDEDVAFTDRAYLVRKPSGSWAVSAYGGKAAGWRVWEFESEEAVLWTASKGLARGHAVSLGGSADVWHLFEAVGRKGTKA